MVFHKNAAWHHLFGIPGGASALIAHPPTGAHVRVQCAYFVLTRKCTIRYWCQFASRITFYNDYGMWITFTSSFVDGQRETTTTTTSFPVALLVQDYHAHVAFSEDLVAFSAHPWHQWGPERAAWSVATYIFINLSLRCVRFWLLCVPVTKILGYRVAYYERFIIIF